jgi:hypothetical protein
MATLARQWILKLSDREKTAVEEALEIGIEHLQNSSKISDDQYEQQAAIAQKVLDTLMREPH